MEEIIIMGDVEIVVKVPEGIPREVVERAIRREIHRMEEMEKFAGILKGMDVEETLREVENEWGEL